MTDTPAGAIHDIGFRRYEGPRLGRGWVFRSLMIDTIRGSFGLGRGASAKVIPVVVLVFLSFPAVFFLVQLFLVPDFTGQDPQTYAEFAVSAGFFFTVFFATRAPIVVSRDIRSRVLPLYFSRPLARGDYVWARLLGLAGAGAIVIGIPMTIMFIGALLSDLAKWPQVLDYVQGVGLVAVMSLVIAAITMLLASLASQRGWGTAVIVTAYVLGNGFSEFTFNIFGFNGGATERASAVRLLDPYDTVAAFAARFLGADVGANVLPTGVFGAAVSLAGLALFLALPILLIHLRYRKLGAK